MMADFDSLKRDLLAECEDDFVGLWSVIGYIEDEMPGAGEAKIRKATLDLLHALLKAGRIQAGFPESNGRTFHPWPFSADVVIDKIKALWRPNAPRPKPGEIAWFTRRARKTVPSFVLLK